eukprot:NODE_5826_length_549_cov_47.472000_g5083_i0.p2 GENE.NODE_5826_length_549_cov_47.472000_g5083_i0~~NODE_5826_length_549_cov_47.472000_g5083_i0.p2  ORF type:complete len:125 (-),score=27.63 NODE_5826_length_549_cov_47.472000_g5083_i0:85-459(-)
MMTSASLQQRTPATPSLSLLVVTHTRDGLSFEMCCPSITIGKGPRPTSASLKDHFDVAALETGPKKVSRLHARICHESSSFYILNYSSNGTKVDQALVFDDPVPLKDGCTILLGDVSLAFHVGS